ncbi:MAG: alpha/beta fold hydrolase [Mucilaginibacter sp.]
MILLLFFVVSAFAQAEPEANKTALKQFIQLYNTGQIDSIYKKCSAETRSAFPLDQFKTGFGQLKTQLGNITNTEFVTYGNSITSYKTTFEKSTMLLDLAINERDQFLVLLFKNYEPKNELTLDPSLTESPYLVKTLSGSLSGTIVKPANADAKTPLVLIIAGSGPTDRNGNNASSNLNANTYALLANDLGKKGIATLRYDKRRIGQSISSTKESETRFDDMIEDAVVILNDLTDKKEFSKLVVLGHSEGSLVGMMATNDVPVKGFISVAGPGESADKVLTEQMKTQPKYIAEGFQRVLDSLRKGKLTPIVDPNLYRFARPSIQLYLMSWCRFEPARELKKLKIPVLLVQGTTDLQVGIPQVEKLKKAKSDAQLLIIPNMNHVLKEAPADAAKNMETYANPSLPIKPELVTGIADFVNKLK